MAMTEDMDYPRLTPPDDRYPASGSLFRTPPDLTDEQFDLLDAARAGDALSGENLSEFDLILSLSPDRRARADSFRQLQLCPLDERMEDISGLLKTPPAVKIIRHMFIATIAAAAVVLAFFTLRPFAGRQADNLKPADLPELTIVSEKGINPIIRPVITQKDTETEPSTSPEAVKINETVAANPSIDRKTAPLTTASQAAVPVLASLTSSEDLRHVSFREINFPATPVSEENWIVKGFALFSGAIRKDDKSTDGYAVADACIKAINMVLGSEMELKMVISETGDPVAVSFSSSLLSFSAPAKKSTK
jgi:predicted secreted protein